MALIPWIPILDGRDLYSSIQPLPIEVQILLVAVSLVLPLLVILIHIRNYR